MPLGSSSAAPVTRPGPNWRTRRRADPNVDPVLLVALVMMPVVFGLGRELSSGSSIVRRALSFPSAHDWLDLNGPSERANDPQPGPFPEIKGQFSDAAK